MKAVQLKKSEFYAHLEDDKERCLELVARIEKRRQSVESLIVDLKNAEERGEMRNSKLQESLNVTQELCRSLQHFLQVKETTAKEFQETQQRLGLLITFERYVSALCKYAIASFSRTKNTVVRYSTPLFTLIISSIQSYSTVPGRGLFTTGIVELYSWPPITHPV